MAGTPRKAPQKTVARKTTPRAARSVEPAVDRFDILAELALEGLPPLPVTLKGVDADIRRAFTGEEAVEFGILLSDNRFEELLELITDNGSGLWEKIKTFSPEHAAVALNAIVSRTGLHEGKAVVPLPPSVARMAGVQPSPDSDASIT